MRQVPQRTLAGECVVVVPPKSGGVRDYADILARATGARLAAYKDGRLDAIEGPCETFESLYLQMSGYGYQKRGVPLDLVGWLQRQKARGVRIGIFFHELFAFGPPWSSSFWLSPAQRYVVARCAGISDYWITNRQASADWLLRWSAWRPHKVLPTPSNVGELSALPMNKSRRIVVFGAPGMRASVYRAGGGEVLEWAARHRYAIDDIGGPLADADLVRRLEAHGVARHGWLEPGGIGRILKQAAIGVIAYPTAYVAKSSVFAAYCAHGLCPVVYSDDHTRFDGVARGKTHAGRLGALEPEGGQIDAMAAAAFDWYAGHRIERHVEGFVGFAARGAR